MDDLRPDGDWRDAFQFMPVDEEGRSRSHSEPGAFFDIPLDRLLSGGRSDASFQRGRISSDSSRHLSGLARGETRLVLEYFLVVLGELALLVHAESGSSRFAGIRMALMLHHWIALGIQRIVAEDDPD